MRKIACALAVLVTAPVSPVYAEAERPEAVIEMYYNGTMGTGHLQDAYCASPRTGTTASCNADYMKLFEQSALALGWRVMYDRSLRDNQSRTMQFYYDSYKRNFDEMKKQNVALEAKYGPIMGVRRGPPPSQTSGSAPKVLRTQAKQ